jgi:hypothetical protein
VDRYGAGVAVVRIGCFKHTPLDGKLVPQLHLKEIISGDEVYRVFPIEDMDSEEIAMNSMPEIFE